MDVVVEKAAEVGFTLASARPYTISDICENLPEIYPLTNQNRLEVLWRTLCVDHHIQDYNDQRHPAPAEVS